MYLRKTDGSPPVRLGEGSALGISPDGLWAMTSNMATPPQIVLLPTGAGEPRQVTHDAIQHLDACWLPDSKHIVFEGVESGHKARVYFQAMEGEGPRPITAEGLSGSLRCSPQGTLVSVRSQQQTWLVPVDGGSLRRPGIGRDDGIVGWTTDGRAMLVTRTFEVHPKREKSPRPKSSARLAPR